MMESSGVKTDNVMNYWFNGNVARNWTSVGEEYRVDFESGVEMGRYGKVCRGFSIFRNVMVAVKVVNKD